jgi:DNA polymerase-3 subunit delta
MSSETDVLAALEKRDVAPVYVLVGDDEVGKKPLIEALSGLVEPDLQAFNLQRIYANERSVEDIVAAARTLPLLGDRRVVIALRCELFLKPKRKNAETETGDDEARPEGESETEAGTDATSELARYLAKPSPETCLVLVAADMARNLRLAKQLIKSAVVVEYWGFKGDREVRGRDLARALGAAESFVRDRLQKAGFRIRPEAIEPLLAHSGPDKGVLRNDLERLVLYCAGRSEVTQDDVARVVGGAILLNTWAMLNAIERNDVAEALRQLVLQLDEGTSPHMIVGQLRKFVSDTMSASAPGRVTPATEALLRTDMALKSSGGDPQVLLERLIVELCGKPRSSRAG